MHLKHFNPLSSEFRRLYCDDDILIQAWNQISQPSQGTLFSLHPIWALNIPHGQTSAITFMRPSDKDKDKDKAVFKKGSRQVASNYRPVSLTCVSYKVLEHIVFRAIMDHVDFHKILVFFQHGFRSKHSCETQLVNTIEDLAKGLNDKQ